MAIPAHRRPPGDAIPNGRHDISHIHSQSTQPHHPNPVSLLKTYTSGPGDTTRRCPNSDHKLCGTLLTDLNPHASATVQASYNLVRCLGAGAGIAAQQPLTDAVGLGWCFGVFAAVMLLLGVPLAAALRRYGLHWRR